MCTPDVELQRLYSPFSHGRNAPTLAGEQEAQSELCPLASRARALLPIFIAPVLRRKDSEAQGNEESLTRESQIQRGQLDVLVPPLPLPKGHQDTMRHDQRRTVLFPAPPAPQAINPRNTNASGQPTQAWRGFRGVSRRAQAERMSRRMLYLPLRRSLSSHLGSASAKTKQNQHTKCTV